MDFARALFTEWYRHAAPLTESWLKIEALLTQMLNDAMLITRSSILPASSRHIDLYVKESAENPFINQYVSLRRRTSLPFLWRTSCGWGSGPTTASGGYSSRPRPRRRQYILSSPKGLPLNLRNTCAISISETLSSSLQLSDSYT